VGGTALNFGDLGAVPAQPQQSAATPPPASPQGMDFSDLGAVPTQPAAPQDGSVDDTDLVGRRPGETYLQGVQRRLSSLNEGAGKGIDSGMAGIEGLILKIPGASHLPGLQAQHDKDVAAAAAPVQGNHLQGDVQVGSDMESMLEFMSGDAVATKAGKALSTVEKLKELGTIGKLAERYPGLAHVLGVGARQAVVAGAQTAVHGGTSDDVAHSAEGALLLGSLSEMAPGGPATSLASRVDAIAPTTRTIAGEEIPVLASQQPGASAAARSAADISAQPDYQALQQQGAAKAVGNIAKTAVSNALADVNAGRQALPVETNPARLLPAPADAKPFTFSIEGPEPPSEAQMGSSEGRGVNYAGQREVPNPNYRPESLPEQQGEIGTSATAIPERAITGEPTNSVANWQYIPPAAGEGGVLTSGSGTLQTADPTIARSTLSQLQDIQEAPEFSKLSPSAQQRINDNVSTLQDQLQQHGAYAAQSPHFQPADIPGAVDQTTNFRDAAEQIEGAVQPVYQRLDQLSDNEWGALRTQEQAQLRIKRNATSPDAYDSASQRLESIRTAQQGILDANRESISPEEWRAANQAWRMASTARDLHATLESTTNGIPTEISQSTGIDRTMKGGTPAFKRITNLLDKRGSDVKQLIGQDGVDNLYRVADLLKTPEKAQGFNKLLQQTSMVLRRHGVGLGPIIGGALAHGLGGLTHHAVGGYEGMLAGAAAETMYRKVLNRVATDPAVAKRVAYAVNNGVSVRNAAPLLATMMSHLPSAAKMAVPFYSASQAQNAQQQQQQPQPQGAQQ
jgi:hypothetical protein